MSQSAALPSIMVCHSESCYGRINPPWPFQFTVGRSVTGIHTILSVMRHTLTTPVISDAPKSGDKTQVQEHLDHLLRRTALADRNAFAQLYQMTSPRLMAVIGRILNNPQESADVLQEVFIKLWHQASSYAGSGSAWGWLTVMARHAALDRLKSLQRRPDVAQEEIEGLIDALGTVSACPTDTHGLNQCLAELSSSAREAILLSYVHGYSHSELTERLKSPLGTIKAWIRRGLQELKICLST